MKFIEKKVAWRSPSNIALIKYWGKKGDQLPLNPSLSLTLSKACTETRISYNEKQKSIGEIHFMDVKEDHQKRILSFIEKRKPYFSHIDKYDLRISTKNTFPDQAGIASSASGLSALTLCLMDMNDTFDISKNKNKVSMISRLGSGSACRSLFSDYVAWGAHNSYPHYTNDYATPLSSTVHPKFNSLCNSILVVDDKKKAISSSMGHSLMDNHSYSSVRYENANKKFIDLHQAIEKGDWNKFSQIVIGEAWELHALMMLSERPFTLLLPESLNIIQKIEKFRNEVCQECAWTLDAGPNIHFLYPEKHQDLMRTFIEQELTSHTKTIIYDHMGTGPERINDD